MRISKNRRRKRNNMAQVIIPTEEFAEDLDLRLGRANGNIYVRRPGVEGVHDGQVMVRLKKKRFVILDYSIVPNDVDMQVSQTAAHITVPPGAGKTSCTNTDCNKVGVPCLLYDSEPTEPPSLYMRSGLCFTCQRNLNEKRRTQRKRPNDIGPGGLLGDGSVCVFGSTSIPKKYKHSPGSIIIHPVDGLRPHGDGYSFNEIGLDLQRIVGDVSNDTHCLIDAVSSNADPPPSPTDHNDIAATAAAVAASVVAHPGNLADDAATSAAMDAVAATTAAAAAEEDKANDPSHHMEVETAGAVSVPTGVPTTSEDINALYEKAFRSMNKGIYLLCQWKQSWDSAIAAAVAQESVDDGLADAVASAAAVAAAASENQNANVSSMLSETDDDKRELKSEEELAAAAAAAVAAAEAAAADPATVAETAATAAAVTETAAAVVASFEEV